MAWEIAWQPSVDLLWTLSQSLARHINACSTRLVRQQALRILVRLELHSKVDRSR